MYWDGSHGAGHVVRESDFSSFPSHLLWAYQPNIPRPYVHSTVLQLNCLAQWRRVATQVQAHSSCSHGAVVCWQEVEPALSSGPSTDLRAQPKKSSPNQAILIA